MTMENLMMRNPRTKHRDKARRVRVKAMLDEAEALCNRRWNELPHGMYKDIAYAWHLWREAYDAEAEARITPALTLARSMYGDGDA